MNKIFKINGRKEKYSEEEIIKMLQNNELNFDDSITSPELKKWIKINETIYTFYKEDK